MASLSEEWRDVVGFEGRYSVSSEGRVWSYLRDKELAVRARPNGYKAVTLYTEGKGRTCSVHTLVAEAFFGPRPPGNHVRHLNGDKNDNSRSNLKYGTPRENELDKARMQRNVNRNKTHCPRGHPYSPQNTYVLRKPNTDSRICRACQREHDRQRRKSPTQLPPGDPRHGLTGYSSRHKCRCEVCRLANTEACRNRRRKGAVADGK